MKELNLSIVKINNLLIGVLQKDIDVILPIIYRSKKSYANYAKNKYLKMVWGFGTSIQYNKRDIKMIDLSMLWKVSSGFHQFKYLMIYKDIGIKIDDIIEMGIFSFEEIHLFPEYLQKLLNLVYVWGIIIKDNIPVYLIDLEIFRNYMGEKYEKKL